MSADISWWITVVEIPALAGLFLLIWRARRETDIALEQARRQSSVDISRLREGLAAYKLEVAKSYASIAYIKDVELRLTDHLVRIEAKLDGFNRSSREARP